MKFTIGTVSNFQQYETDLKLIKSSILYADEIELIGLAEYATFKYLPYVLDGNKNLDRFISDLIPFLQSVAIPNKEDVLQQLETARTQLKTYGAVISKKKYRTPAEIKAQMKVRQAQKELQFQLSEAIQELINQQSSHDIQYLIDKKIVSVFDYNVRGINQDELTGSYIASILNAINKPNSFPLFDNASTNMISSIAETKLLDIGNLDSEIIRHAGVATNILMTLPTLESASYDELLDLKQQNAIPLANFRAAVYSFSERISTLPWDKNFQYECLKLYDTEVLPRVTEINDLFTETSTLKNLGRKVLDDEEIRKKAGFMIGGLATAITTTNTLAGSLRNLLLAMAIATFSKEAAAGFLKVINLGLQAHEESKRALKQGKENAMYYYYLASRMS